MTLHRHKASTHYPLDKIVNKGYNEVGKRFKQQQNLIKITN